MLFYVYMLLAKNINKKITYVGYTNNLKNRIKLHNTSKGAKFTKGRTWELIYSKKYPTKIKAMQEEYKLKKDRNKRTIILDKHISKKY